MRRIQFIKFLLVFVLSGFSAFICRAQIVINEYSCSNLSSFADPTFGDYEDWVELYNTTASPVNLNGYYLSDKLTNPTKWKFGSVTINANGFLRIWASGRNIASGSDIHAGFKLTQCKPEDIVLANPAGTIIDSQVLKPAQLGHSRGRTTNGASTWSVFLAPTPNASNANPYQEYATRPAMSVTAGFYPGTQNVTITSPDPNISIRYTTNGSTPTATSTLYSTPVVVSATQVLRAKAFSTTATIPASFIESNTYFIGAASAHTTEVISVFGDQIAALMGGNSSISPTAGLEFFDKTGTFKTESFGETNKHGNDSWAYAQRGIDFVSRDQYGYNYALVEQIFNNKTRTEFQKIILKPAANDNYQAGVGGNLGPAHIRDAYVHVLSQKAGLHLDERSWAPCVVYINGSYWGVYESREKVDDADFTDYYHNTGEDSLQFLKTWGGTWAEYGGPQAISDWNTLKAYILGNNMAIQANYNTADAQFSGKSLVDYVLLNSYVVCTDWLNWNTAWWRGINVKADKKKWRYALWDMDATFDHYINYTGVPSTSANADPCDAQNLPDPGNQGHIPILNALLANPGFKQYYVMRHFDLMNTHFSCARMKQILDSMINVIDPEMQRQCAKWGGTKAGWLNNVADLKNFIDARCLSVVNSYTPCNGVTGVYPIKVNAVPTGAGTVDVNSINVSTFVWTATYPGASPAIKMNFTAHPNPGYCFDHWEFQNHTPTPNTTDTAVSINLSATDSIVAVFTIGGSASVTATQSTIFCGDSTKLQATGGSAFIWTPATGLNNTTISNPTATPTVTTTYTVFTSGQCGADTTSITINVSGASSASVTATATSISCGASTTLQASGGSSYSWSPSAGLNNTTSPNPVATPSATTSYTVIVSSPCGSDTTAITITLTGGSNASVTATAPSVCAGKSTTLIASSGTSYVWGPTAGLSNPSISNPVATPSVTTTYSVMVSDPCGSDTAMVTVTVEQPPVPMVSANQTICSSESAELSASGGDSYIWSPPAGLSCTSCSNPSAAPPSTTTYNILVSSAIGCTSTGTVIVFVSGECPEIYVPTGFSPNGDNNNDMLYVFGVMTDLHFVIYNRWGQIVFETNDKTIGWDGKQGGKFVQSGIYAYKFTATDPNGVVVKKSGNITVIR